MRTTTRGRAREHSGQHRRCVECGTNPRAKGTNPRTVEQNPRALRAFEQTDERSA